MSAKSPSKDATLSANEIQQIFNQTGRTFSGSNVQTAQKPIILDTTAKRIEHTLLKMDASPAQMTRLCEEALQYGFRGVCCNPRYIHHCRTIIQDADVLVVSVIDFPLCGASAKDAAHLAQSAISEGAGEVDMVLDVASLKHNALQPVFDRIALVVSAANGTPVKVILETGYLSEVEIVISCAIARAAGAAFVKTSTGFGARGASVRDIEIMKTAVGDTMGIKASGGIKDAPFARQLINAGADVIGTSAGPACIGD